MLVMSPADKNALLLGTQYVMKTTDGGLHWEKDQSGPDGRSCGIERESDDPCHGGEREGARLWRGVFDRAVAVEGGRDLGGERYGTTAPHD